MIEREEQVAELAKDLREADDTRCLCECDECCFDGIDTQGFMCTDYSLAHFLYHEKEYRKTNTTDTVLTAEEHKAFLKYLLTAQKATAERVRTETAKEILQEMFAFFPKDQEFTHISRLALSLIAKKYGVEVDK